MIYKCEVCGCEFVKGYSYNRFCSTNCVQKEKYQRKRLQYLQYKKRIYTPSKEITIQCKACGKDIIKKEKMRQLYCSRKCCMSEYVVQSRTMLRLKGNIAMKKLRLKNKSYDQALRLRQMLNKAIKKSYIYSSIEKYLTISLSDFRKHLSSKFTEGMNWNNYGKWQLDHIIPCCKFDLTKEEEIYKCFNYNNLQPLWKEDNLRKGTKTTF